MSFKLVILCAAVAAISCTTIQDRNEQYREKQQEFENQQQVFDNQRNQDQFNRERQFNNYNHFNNDGRQFFNNRHNQQQFHSYPNYRTFNHQQGNPTFYHLQPAFISIPSSQRNFNVQDDSHYNFGYAISDVTTGDFKSHQEIRQGDKVQGQFSMIDSDGFRRTVNYRADDVNGFDAEVRRDPANAAIQFQHQFGNNFDNQQFNNQNFNDNNQNAAFFNANIPKSTTSTQVTRVEDGQETNYSTKTTNF